MSNNSVPVPYIGCKLSLVSKSEIRYEGILYSIDTKESTIALNKVKSFGTEHRINVNDRERPVVPPRDEVYEYIIFRATDIKDLHVCETANKSQSVISSGLANDPAIVQHSAPIVPYNTMQCQQPFSQLCGISSLQHLPSQFSSYASHVPQTFFPTHVSGTRSGSSQPSQRKLASVDAGVQVSCFPIKADEKDEGSRLQDASKPNVTSGQRTGQQRGFYSNRRFQRGRGPRRGRGGRGRSNSILRTSEPLKFDSEFDFELANAEFIELENKLGKDEQETDVLAGGDTEENTVAYDKKKSFFDNISCEASRVAKGIPRFDWRVEKKLNVETFGMPVSTNWFRHRRGRGGSGGFRRGGRGRGMPVPNKSGGDVPKAVTFGDKLVTEIERPETPVEIKAEDIPTIEIVESKETVWEETSEVFNQRLK